MAGVNGQTASRRLSMGDALSDRQNTLNFVRLVLASLVILGHAWPLTGSESHPSLEFLSGIAVEGFFVISGYLIAASRMNSSFVSFVWKRILRIMPAFWTVLVVIAVIFGPIASLLDGSNYNWRSAMDFVVRNFFLMMYQWGIDGSVENVPYPNVWNGSLWTLSYEFLAYLAIGLLLTFKLVRRKSIYFLPIIFLMSVIAWWLFRGPLAVSTNFYLNGARLGSYFLAGSAYFAIRKYLPVSRIWLFVSLIIYVLLYFVGLNNYLGQIFLGYVLLVLGAFKWTKIATKNDISYGVYIYAFPVQQILVLAGTAQFGIAVNVILTFVITVGFAWLSWTLIERPSLGLKGIPQRLLDRSTKNKPKIEP
ncbi:acyltransferase family protein [Neomicrococcus lactis]